MHACSRSNLKLPKPFTISLFFGSTVINIWFLVSHRILCLFWDVLHFPFQKIRPLFVGICNEHGLLIHIRSTGKVNFKKSLHILSFPWSCKGVGKLLESSQYFLKCATTANWLQKVKYSGYCTLFFQIIFISMAMSQKLSLPVPSFTHPFCFSRPCLICYFWDIYVHICHMLSHLHCCLFSIAVRSSSLFSLNFKILSPNHLYKPVLKIHPSAILTLSAWPLWTIN